MPLPPLSRSHAPVPTGRDDIFRQPSRVPVAVREDLLGQSGCVVWLTGLSGAGKSTVAFALEQALVADGRLAFVVDGDNLRHGLTADLGFSAEDRGENVRRAASAAGLLADAGVVVIAALISPYRADRQRACELVGAQRFFEVHVDAPIEVCEQRDPKGLYVKARKGEIPAFTGVSDPYEAPEQPDLRVPTAEWELKESVEALEQMLVDRGVLRPKGRS